jgi:Domain of unknown function (DUF4263)
VNRRDPWRSEYIEGVIPTAVELAGFSTVLSTARDEAPIQRLLASTSRIPRGILPSAADAWLFDRPKLGAEHIPDFLLCYRNSIGYNWVLVELESPTQPPLTRRGRPTAKLTEALAQIRDWRCWLRENISYARSTLGFLGIHAEIPAHVLIGRRSHLDPKHALRYQELSLSAGASVMSYDRLLDTPPVVTS